MLSACGRYCFYSPLQPLVYGRTLPVDVHWGQYTVFCAHHNCLVDICWWLLLWGWGIPRCWTHLGSKACELLWVSYLRFLSNTSSKLHKRQLRSFQTCVRDKTNYKNLCSRRWTLLFHDDSNLFNWMKFKWRLKSWFSLLYSMKFQNQSS